jgi:hypothetical protein
MFGVLAVDVCDEDVVAILDFIVKTIVKVCLPPLGLPKPMEA